MRLKLFNCLSIAIALVCTAQALAAPLNNPFLSVDIDLQRGPAGVTGPTQAGFQSWHIVADADPLDGAYDPATDWNTNGAAPTGLTKTFGSVTATLGGATYNGTTRADSRSGRDRGANAGANSDLYRDFVFEQIANQASGANFGRNYIKLVLSGLTPNQLYEFTGFAREDAFNSTDFTDPNAPSVSFQAWTDLFQLGGLDGPAAWMDAKIFPGVAYAPAIGGTNNSIPHLGRSQVSGPDSLATANPYYFSASFITQADATGKITVYTWSDPNSPQIAQTQGATLLNGFQLGVATIVPEPASLTILSVGAFGLMFGRRRLK
jgi:hypothetical protein